MKSILKVNGVYIQNPQSYQVTIQDLDSEDGSGRNQLGEMMRDRVAVKRKVSCTFPPLLQHELSELLKSVKDEFFILTYIDPELGMTDMQAYVGDRSMGIYRKEPTTNIWRWHEIKFNFVER